ncbi:hypothetical protein SJ144_23800, partial [Enterobacter kobei]|nr:hypothetical protein [Enterobacter kobei]
YAEFDPQMTTTNRDFRREFTVLSRNKPQQDVLELKLGSIEIHEIRGVKYTSLVTPVGHKEISLSAAEAEISHAKSKSQNKKSTKLLDCNSDVKTWQVVVEIDGQQGVIMTDRAPDKA